MASPRFDLSPDDIAARFVVRCGGFNGLNRVEGNRNTIVFCVAPAPIIWSVIADFGAYPKWVKMVKETEVYRREQHDVYVRFRIAHWLLGRYTYHMRHTFSWQQKDPWKPNGPGQQREWVTWQLDDSQTSDFRSAIGFWQVLPVPGNRDQSDVVYSADLRFKDAKPEWLRRFVVKRSLEQATDWVKTQAEARWRDRSSPLR